MLSKFTTSWIAFFLFLFVSSLLVRVIQKLILDSQSETFPLNQLERGVTSRKTALNQLKDFIMLIRTPEQTTDSEVGQPIISNQSMSRFARQISNELSILQGFGLTTLTSELGRLLNKETSLDNLEEEETWLTGNMSDSFTRHFVTHRFCYEKTFTPQGVHRQVDPSFCPRLMSLFNDIQLGLQPPLLTLFTWLPDPLTDVDKLRRRLLFQNWDLLRPIVQPVLFSDSRMNMALANSFDWPCLPISSDSSLGVPVFKTMASTIATQFNSTFYGYVRSTTIFDSSLVETLLKLKEIYIDKYTGNRSHLNWNGQKNSQSHPSVRPVLVYGRALRASRAGDMNDLQHISEVVNTTEGHSWTDRKDSLVYFFYSQVNFSDIPDLIVDDKYLTSPLVSRSMALGHLVVDASATIFAVHIFRDKTTSEWDREYVQTKPRDPYFNKRLGGQYFHSLGIRKPDKWLNEVGTKVSRSGNIFIDIRSEGTA